MPEDLKSEIAEILLGVSCCLSTLGMAEGGGGQCCGIFEERSLGKSGRNTSGGSVPVPGVVLRKGCGEGPGDHSLAAVPGPLQEEQGC